MALGSCGLIGENVVLHVVGDCVIGHVIVMILFTEALAVPVLASRRRAVMNMHVRVSSVVFYPYLLFFLCVFLPSK